LLIADITGCFSLFSVTHTYLGCCVLKLAKVKVYLAPHDVLGVEV